MDPEEGARSLRRYVTDDLLPAWLSCGVAPDGGFHERLDAELRPKDLGYRRLLSQCRQVFSFGEAALLGAPSASREQALIGFGPMLRFCDPATGAWHFAHGEGAPLPANTRHLYAYAFVVLACTTLERHAPAGVARDLGGEVLADVHDTFRRPGGGFHSAIDEDGQPLPLPFSQNPHMHLFEACVFRLEAAPDPLAQAMAGELVDLLLDRFLDPTDGTLIEYLDLDPSADDRGRIREPGHHFEWVWLIARWLRLADSRGIPTRRRDLETAAIGLLSWAVRQTLAHPEGALGDEVDANGQMITPTHRIWPVLEAVKGLAFARQGGWSVEGADEAESRLWRLLFARYLHEGTGRWTEGLGPDLSPTVSDHPATTMYHIVMAARELAGLNAV